MATDGERKKETDPDQNVEENGDMNLLIDCFNTDPYEKKYFALLRRCESIQQSNERLVNRIHHVQKLLGKYRHERRFLMKRLDQHGDDYLSIPVSFPTEEEIHSFTSSSSQSTNKLPSSDIIQAKKKIKTENKKGNTNPFHLLTQSLKTNEDIKNEIKNEFTNDDLSKNFIENWNSEDKKNLFYTSLNIKQELE